MMEIWDKVQRWWNFPFSSFNFLETALDGIDATRYSKVHRKGIEAIFMITCFSIWCLRNKFLFEKSKPRLSDLFDVIVDKSFRWMIYRCKGSTENFVEWSSTPSTCLGTM